MTISTAFCYYILKFVTGLVVSGIFLPRIQFSASIFGVVAYSLIFPPPNVTCGWEWCSKWGWLSLLSYSEDASGATGWPDARDGCYNGSE